MISNKPLTYSDIIRKKYCYTLANNFYMTQEILDEIYDFLSSDSSNYVSTTSTIITLYNKDNSIYKTIPANAKNTLFDSIKIDNKNIVIIPHYNPSSSGSSGGGSSNNNNNNNTNNNNNNNN